MSQTLTADDLGTTVYLRQEDGRLSFAGAYAPSHSDGVRGYICDRTHDYVGTYVVRVTFADHAHWYVYRNGRTIVDYIVNSDYVAEFTPDAEHIVDVPQA
jgi:hypothetical protein